MPRTSKRNLCKTGGKNAVNTVSFFRSSAQPEKLYRAAIYARISSDQEKNAKNHTADKAKNCESVETQIDIARKHITHLAASGERIELHDIYSDLGKTGTNFRRDEFTRMMLDIRMGEVNCVIVKDLSRFGRNYLEAGNYIEKIFPFLGVRFIAVSDGFDTGLWGNEEKKIAMNIKNLVNDMYAMEFSDKAKIHLKQRRERGSYVGGPTPYGYTYEWVSHANVSSSRVKKLIIEPATRPVVEMIFSLFLEKNSYDMVRKRLNLKRINPPAVYRQTHEVFCPEGQEYKGWNKDGIKRILQSTTYAGTLTQGKTRLTGRNEENRVKVKKEEWTVTYDSHEAIVNSEEFEKVQQIIAAKYQKAMDRNCYSDRIPLPENIFDDVLFCGICGRKMTRHNQVKTYKNGSEKRQETYGCLNTYVTRTEKRCKSNRISKEKLVDILLSALRVEFAAYLEKPKYYIEENARVVQLKKKEYLDQIRKIRIRTGQMEADEINLHIHYRTGEIGQEKYKEAKLKNSLEKENLKGLKEAMEDHIRSLDHEVRRQNRAIRNVLNLNQCFEPMKEFVNSLVDRIYLYPGKRVEIFYSFYPL